MNHVLIVDGPQAGQTRPVEHNDFMVEVVPDSFYSQPIRGVTIGRSLIRYYVHSICRSIVTMVEGVPFDLFVSYSSDDLWLLEWMGKTREIQLNYRCIWKVASVQSDWPVKNSAKEWFRDLIIRKLPAEIHCRSDSRSHVVPTDYRHDEFLRTLGRCYASEEELEYMQRDLSRLVPAMRNMR